MGNNYCVIRNVIGNFITLTVCVKLLHLGRNHKLPLSFNDLVGIESPEKSLVCWLDLKESPFSVHKCDTGAQNPSLVVFGGFFFSHILHCICFKMHFTESKYLVSNWSYTCLIRTIKKVKNLNKKFKIFLVIIIICCHYFIENLFLL